MKHGDEGPVTETSISVVEALNSWVNEVSLSFKTRGLSIAKC
jgi:hypothetical protein